MAKKKKLSISMTQQERTLGWVYFFIELFLLPGLLSWINGLLPHPFHTATLNFIFFSVNFACILMIFHNFLGRSLSAAGKQFWDFLQSSVLGFVAYWVLSMVLAQLIQLLLPGFANVNDQSIAALAGTHYVLMFIGTVILVPTVEETEIYQTYLLLCCGREYARHGWAMQLHFSCFRNPNTRMFRQLGADSGFDCIAVTNSSAALHNVMNALEETNELPKTIIYSLNPADNQWLDALLGAYQSAQIPGKIQHGSAWWFNDNKVGMQDQMVSLAQLGVLGNFIGMLTDSRSFLSYARHEYFRRILCNLLGTWVENGEYPADWDMLRELVTDICCRNAMRYFNL